MTRSVLMCEPVYFRIDYEINPWMRRSNAVAGPRALSQWRSLRDLLAGIGIDIELVAQDSAVPDMTFTANAGIAVGRRFIPSNFRFPERQAEAALFTQWFVDHGYEVETIHEPHFWEGEGDILPGDEQVFAGYRYRTEDRALDHLEELLGQPLVRLELADPRFYHLDTCFCPLGVGRALYYPPALTETSRALLQANIEDLIEVPPAEAERFACNALVAGETVVLNTGCEATTTALEERGLQCLSTPTDEFIKAGGSVKCLVLMLDAFDRWATIGRPAGTEHPK